MTVQAGVWNFDGQPVDQQLLMRMSEELADYGRDGVSTFIDGQLGMLYQPFHTTQESRLERQPYKSVSGRVITWDGRLDNRDDLISQLSTDLADDRTDLAIVVAAFEKWGAACFAKLTGDWALALWDPSKQELILARDYVGARQMFYYPTSKSVTWCNSLGPLALSGVELSVCDEYVAGYLAFWPEAHLTPYREIHSVPPGMFVRVRRGSLSFHPYWTFDPNHSVRYKTDAEYEEQFRHLFREAVRCRLRSDSPVLAELSGGLDSSAIVCMADDLRTKESRDTPFVRTFSFFDRGEPDEEDCHYFVKVERKRGRIGHHAELIGLGDTFRLDYPTFIATPGFGLRQELKEAQSEVMAHEQYKVVLSGIGGDQMLGQALDPRVQLADLVVQFHFTRLFKQLMAWSLFLRRPWTRLLAQSVKIALPNTLRCRMAPVAKVQPWLNPNFAKKHRIRERLLPASAGSWSWLPSSRESFQMLQQLAGQMTDVPAFTLETRYPFLDQRLTTFLMAIPTDQLLRPGERRSLMRRALVDIVPGEILQRLTKSGTGRCISMTLQKHWNTIETALPLAHASRYIDDERFRKELLALKNGRMPLYSVQLLRGLSLELWLRDALKRGVIATSKSGSDVEAPTTGATHHALVSQ